MKRNIADLPEVIRLGQRLGADRFSVSNVLAHTPELRDQVLYARSIDVVGGRASRWSPTKPQLWCEEVSAVSASLPYVVCTRVISDATMSSASSQEMRS